MKLTIHPDASAEIETEAQYYEDQAPGLGKAFLAAVDAAIGRITESPTQFPAEEHGLQKCVVDRFPSTIRFRARGGEVLVLVVRHDARRPDYGVGRE